MSDQLHRLSQAPLMKPKKKDKLKKEKRSKEKEIAKLQQRALLKKSVVRRKPSSKSSAV